MTLHIQIFTNKKEKPNTPHLLLSPPRNIQHYVCQRIYAVYNQSVTATYCTLTQPHTPAGSSGVLWDRNKKNPKKTGSLSTIFQDNQDNGLLGYSIELDKVQYVKDWLEEGWIKLLITSLMRLKHLRGLEHLTREITGQSGSKNNKKLQAIMSECNSWV